MTFIVSSYFLEWGIYARKYYPSNVPASKLTHLMYAFAKPTESGALNLSNVFTNNIFKTPSVQGKVYGLCEQINNLKRQNRALKVMLSIGGGSGSEVFATIMPDDIKRKTLVDNCVSIIEQYGFDGIDLDWEYPLTTEDAAGLARFMAELREAFDKITYTNRLLISIAVNASLSKLNALNISQFHKNIDFVNIMGYDYCGPWTKTAGYHSNLFIKDSSSKKNTNTAVDYLISQGVPKNKIVLGVPFYGRAFCNTMGVGCNFNGTIKGTWEDNIFDYNKLPLPNTEETYDTQAVAAHCYNDENKTLITYDNPQSVNDKLNYIIENELGGIMSWSINGDHPQGHPRCLVDLMYNKLSNNLDQTENNINFPNSKFVNINNVNQRQ